MGNAVLMLNLGSPASTDPGDVGEYLKEFLTDERVIDAPGFIRHPLVKGLIVPKRKYASAEAYGKIWWEDGSPLLVISRRQQNAVASGRDFPVVLGMRYGEPSIANAIRELKEAGVTNLFVMPLYPQYAMSSYETVVVRVEEELQQQAPEMQVAILPPFYNDPAYLEAMAESIKPQLGDAGELLMFSFHGIPERHLRKSDPSHAHCLSRSDCCEIEHPCHATCYRHQCFTAARLIAEELGLEKTQWRVTFQSRLGRDPWLRPYTDKTLEALPSEGIKRVKVVCPAFVADCLETLEEIAMGGKETFLEAGGESFAHIPCLNDSPAFIRFLHAKVDAWLAKQATAAEAATVEL